MEQYSSPLGTIFLSGDDSAITGLWFEGQAYFPSHGAELPAPSPQLLRQVSAWLDAYFKGDRPPACPPLFPSGTTFQQTVWQALRQIPYGKIISYSALARSIGSSPRAVGSAIGRNPISLLIPCHRVLGASGSLTGYAGGLERKRALLRLEGTLSE